MNILVKDGLRAMINISKLSPYNKCPHFVEQPIIKQSLLLLTQVDSALLKANNMEINEINQYVKETIMCAHTYI